MGFSISTLREASHLLTARYEIRTGVPNKDKTIERTRALGWKQEKGW